MHYISNFFFFFRKKSCGFGIICLLFPFSSAFNFFFFLRQNIFRFCPLESVKSHISSHDLHNFPLLFSLNPFRLRLTFALKFPCFRFFPRKKKIPLQTLHLLPPFIIFLFNSSPPFAHLWHILPSALSSPYRSRISPPPVSFPLVLLTPFHCSVR